MRRRILVVEDNAANLDLISYVLGALGHDVVCASNGISALQLAGNGPFDLILADILMPQMDGFELARALKADPLLSGIPLVAVTALAMAGDREKILASGFDGYIAKPIDPKHFGSRIQTFLSTGARGNSSDR